MPTRSLPPPVAGADGSSLLRAAVVSGDAAALALGWVVVVRGVAVPLDDRVLWLGGVAIVVVGLLALRAAGAHQRRRSRIRREELLATTKAALGPTGLLLVVLPPTATSLPLLVAAAVCWALLLAATRAAIGEWLRGLRARGRHQTPVLVVGTGRAQVITDFLTAHPHLGYAVIDTVELLPEEPHDCLRLLGDLADEVRASGLVVTDPGDPVVQPLLPALTRMGLHVHVATGVQGFELRSTLTSSLAGECFLDIAPAAVPRRHRAAIRASDVVLATLGLLLTAPVWAPVALGLRWSHPDPVLARRPRVGRHDRPFELLRFRTAPAGSGTLGRALRRTGLERLPELGNVLRGDMSIVGPAPAHPHAHAALDDEHRRRTEVRPGLTGLWQVEAPHLPGAELHRRLDLLYVDNRSPGLYASIALRALTSIGGRTARAVVARSGAVLPRLQPDARPRVRYEVQARTGSGGHTWGDTNTTR